MGVSRDFLTFSGPPLEVRPPTDFHAKWLKRRGFTQGCAFCSKNSYFFKICHRIIELQWPIVVKLCHVISMCLNFIMQVQTFGAVTKKWGQKYTKFCAILHKYWLWLRIFPKRVEISKIGKTCDRERFLPRSVKQVQWTLVHYPESRMWVWTHPTGFFSGDYSIFWPLGVLSPQKFFTCLYFQSDLQWHC